MGTIKQNVEDKFINQHPTEREYITPFLTNFDITYGDKKRISGSEYSFIFMQPEEHTKESYGFQKEILLVYSLYNTFDSRTILATEDYLKSYPAFKRVDNLNIIVVSNDRNCEQWLLANRDLSDESRIFIPFYKKELIDNKSDSWYVRNTLNKHLYGRDLFAYTLPLTEDTYFFGRTDIIARNLDSLKRGVNKGIFGLRKTGKTSLQLKLTRAIADQKLGHHFFYDCKSPSIRKLRWHQFLHLICTQIAKRLRIGINIYKDEIEIIKSFRELMRRVNSINMKIFLFFDEIEYVSFKAKLDPHWNLDYIEFWQTIWSVQSSYKNPIFLVAGVNPSIIEVDTIEEIQNPLFGIVSAEYLTGFSEEEVKTMTKTLGKRMGLKFDHESIEYIFSRYGGHPMLSRLACSWVNKQMNLNSQPKPLTLTKANLESDEQDRDSDLTFYCKHVVSELKQFYPEEYEMLELLASGQSGDFSELSAHAEFIRHLRNYGLLSKDNYNNFQISIPVVGRYVGLELAKKESRQTIYKIVDKEKRNDWLNRRIEAILRDLRSLEKLIKVNNLQTIYGPTSIDQADKFKELPLAENEGSFSNFINVMNKCFVESCVNYGNSINDNQFFWQTIKSYYPSIFYSLKRVKVYRHDAKHLKLTNSTDQTLLEYLKNDLEGRKPAETKDFYFVLQQRTLDSLLASIHNEMNLIN